MPNHTVQYWTDWVVRHNKAFPDRDVHTTILIGTRPNGVEITLANGITASIQWTKGNYCSRRSLARGAHIDPHDPSGSPDAELAFWNSDGIWYHFGSDVVIGHQTVEETSQWLMRADGSTRFLPLETDIVRCEDCYLPHLKTTMLRDGDLWYCDDCAPSDPKVGATAFPWSEHEDLLEAAKRAAEAHAHFMSEPEWLSDLRAAIAKAEGGDA